MPNKFVDRNVWRPIATAPKDGTVVWGKNEMMQEPCKMKWGPYVAPWGTTYTDWNTEFTAHKFFPVPSGRLICPQHWRPLSAKCSAGVRAAASKTSIPQGKKEG